MDLFEHQAKELFAEYGIPVPAGKVAHTPAEARAAAVELARTGAPRVVVKAQVKAGGRGKAGGVKLADGPDQAREEATKILGMDIKTARQPSPRSYGQCSPTRTPPSLRSIR